MDYSVIKEGDLFLTTGHNGDISGSMEKGYGLYTQDTRFLSTYELTVNGSKPSLLSSNDDKNYTALIRLVETEEDVGATEVLRERFIHNGILYEKLTFTNYFLEDKQLQVGLKLGVDFQDMFIVRDFLDGEVGEKTGYTYEGQSMTFGYQGKDGIKRETVIEWDVPTDHISESGSVHFSLELSQREQKSILFTIQPVINGHIKTALHFNEASAYLEGSYQEWLEQGTRVESDHPTFEEVYKRGAIDTRMLMSNVGFGDIPVAGVPWFCVPFGRDSLITSLFMLSYHPEKIKGTLRTLAHYQGKKERPERDEQPGKIMHEIRFGELSSTGQIPFTPYYGTVDATPLFVILATEYYQWTGDAAFIKELKPAIDDALHWIDHYGSMKEDEFVQYARSSEDSFINQGWKDSDNSNVHQDGTLANEPIALVEVQGYVYQAKTNLAKVYKKIGEAARAEQLEKEASRLCEQFDKAFWMEKEAFYALALDGKGNQVKAITSNPGHLLMSGMLGEDRAAKVADKLVKEGLFSGYGIRTMSDVSVGYYPMSYHNGSVWPHDNAMVLLGLSKNGKRGHAAKVIEGLLNAADYFENLRLPELFCGYSREEDHLVPYPTTCSPQAWAATSSFVFLQSIMGVKPDAFMQEVSIAPVFPAGMNQLKVEGMRVGDGNISLIISKKENDYDIEVIENTSGWKLNVKE